MNDDRIDFSPLDPKRDQLRWERMVRSVAARAASQARTKSLSAQLRGWARPALAMAAGVALAIWGAALVQPHRATTRSETDPAMALSSWADTGQLPDTAQLLSTLGGEHGTR